MGINSNQIQINHSIRKNIGTLGMFNGQWLPIKNKVCALNITKSNLLIINTIVLIPLLSLLKDSSNNRNLLILGCFLIPLISIIAHKKYLNNSFDSGPFKGIPHLNSVTKEKIDELNSNFRLHEINKRIGLTSLAINNRGVASCMYGDTPYILIVSFEAFNQLISRRHFIPTTPFKDLAMLPKQTTQQKKDSNCQYKKFMQNIRPTLIHSDPLFKRLSVIPEMIRSNLPAYVSSSQSLGIIMTSINMRLFCSLPDMLSLNVDSIKNEDLVLFKSRSEYAQKFLGSGPKTYTDKDREVKSWVISFMHRLIENNFDQLSKLTPNSNLIQLAFSNRGQRFPESIERFNQFAISNIEIYEKIMIDLIGQAGPGTFSRSVSDLLAGMVFCIEKCPDIKKLVLDELSSVDFTLLDFSDKEIDSQLPNLTLLILELHRYLSTNNFITGVIAQSYETDYNQHKLTIPVGTRVVLETAKCTRDPDLYENPNEIDINNIRSVKKNDTTYKFLLSNSHGPWGVFGRRPCPARVSITYVHILTIASIYKYFKINIQNIGDFSRLENGDEIHNVLSALISFSRID
ncbi:MAG: hypothetical protein VXX85_06510 [Candidatus Margulisiibacteriota bacterium]|nr:hypothetical protein [Candidatus Margulisiibacteriota bacterium]